MKRKTIGNSELEVSTLCLGSMTWGYQNTLEEGHAQLDMAIDGGINFIDTAEMYPVPRSPEHGGETERIIGEWFLKTGKRKDVILASKMAGPGGVHRSGGGLTPAEVEAAVDASLKRLKTDHIDLYQLHWPQRQTNIFAQRDFQADKHTSLTGEDIEGMLEALDKEIKKGRIRYIGLSNETPWGVMQYLKIAAEKGLPRVISVQNPYSLMQRNYDVHMGEVSMREGVDLLAYSPLAGGILSGKYLDGHRPQGARFTEEWGKSIMSRNASLADSAHVRFYASLAAEAGLTAAQFALAFVNSRPYLGANIIGASSTEQLQDCLSSAEVTLNDDILEKIEEYHDQHPSPSLTRFGLRDSM